MNIEKIILSILNEIEEKVVKVSGGKGYGVGKIFPSNINTPFHGKEEIEKKQKYILKPVKISKAFKRKEKK